MEDPHLKADRLFTHHTKRSLVASTLRENRLLHNQKLHLEAERRTLAGEYRYQIQRVKQRAEHLKKVKAEQLTKVKVQTDVKQDVKVGGETVQVSRWSHLLPKIRELRRKIQEQEGTGEKVFVTLGGEGNTKGSQKLRNKNFEKDKNFKESERTDKRTQQQRDEITQTKARENENSEGKDGKNGTLLETVRESEIKSAESASTNQTASNTKQHEQGEKKQERNTRGEKSRVQQSRRSRSLPPITEEEMNSTHISNVALARTKAGNLVRKHRARNDKVFEATGEFMANLNNLSRITEQKILDILSQQKGDLETLQVPASRISPQSPNRVSPSKLNTVLGAMRRKSKQNPLETHVNTIFAQKRQSTLAEQDIKDPLLQMVCQTPVSLPPVSEGFLFEPVQRNWAVEDVVFPEHTSEPPSKQEWSKLRYCLYLRGRHTTHK